MAQIVQSDGPPIESDQVHLGFIITFMSVCFIIMLAIWLYPRGPYLTVISNPFGQIRSIQQLAAASNSQIINEGRFHFILNVYAPQPAAVQHLFSSGAFLVIRNFAPTTCLQEV